MSDNNCDVKRLSIRQLNNLLKNIKENIIKDNDEYKDFTKEKLMKLLNIYTWENDFYIGIKKNIDNKVGGIKSKKSKTRNKRTKSNYSKSNKSRSKTIKNKRK
jgi:hypothetical protein